MTGPLNRGGPVRFWWVALVLAMVLGGCSGTIAKTEPGATSTETAPAPDSADLTSGSADPEPATGDADSATEAGEHAAASATPGSSSGLECGLTTYTDGHQAVRYCGEGEATIRLSTSTTLIEGAECDLRGSFLTVNFGSSFSNPGAAEGDYLGLILGDVSQDDGDAAPDHVAMDLVLDGEQVPVLEPEATTDLSEDRLSATLSGERADGGSVEITLACDLEAD